MDTNRSMPPRVIIPEIPYADVIAAASWLCDALGFKKRLQIGHHRFQLKFGETSIVAIERQESNPSFSIMVHVENVDGLYEQAVSRGAKLVSPPTDYPFGERQGTVKDLGGHRWTFSQTIADIDPALWGGILVE
jgi:uncharacterized glyoxalase superfamily protein PhnB